MHITPLAAHILSDLLYRTVWCTLVSYLLALLYVILRVLIRNCLWKCRKNWFLGRIFKIIVSRNSHLATGCFAAWKRKVWNLGLLLKAKLTALCAICWIFAFLWPEECYQTAVYKTVADSSLLIEFWCEDKWHRKVESSLGVLLEAGYHPQRSNHWKVYILALHLPCYLSDWNVARMWSKKQRPCFQWSDWYVQEAQDNPLLKATGESMVNEDGTEGTKVRLMVIKGNYTIFTDIRMANDEPGHNDCNDRISVEGKRWQ